MAGVVTSVRIVATLRPETIAWDSGTQKAESELPNIIVRLMRSILKFEASGSKPKIVVADVSTTGLSLWAPVLMSSSK